jgi:uncharacterized protein (TIGR02246 family)
MTKVLLYSLILKVSFLTALCAVNETDDIQSFASNYASAWNKHDPKSLAKFWADDANLLSPWAKVYNGKKEIEQHLVSEHQNGMKDSHLDLAIQNVRFLDSDVAFVDADVTLIGMKVAGEKAAPLHTHAIFLLTKRDKKWQILIARVY